MNCPDGIQSVACLSFMLWDSRLFNPLGLNRGNPPYIGGIKASLSCQDTFHLISLLKPASINPFNTPI